MRRTAWDSRNSLDIVGIDKRDHHRRWFSERGKLQRGKTTVKENEEVKNDTNILSLKKMRILTLKRVGWCKSVDCHGVMKGYYGSSLGRMTPTPKSSLLRK